MAEHVCIMCLKCRGFQSPIAKVCIWCWAKCRERWCPCLDNDPAMSGTKQPRVECDRAAACVFPRTTAGLPPVPLRLPPMFARPCKQPSSGPLPPPVEYGNSPTLPTLNDLRPATQIADTIIGTAKQDNMLHTRAIVSLNTFLKRDQATALQCIINRLLSLGAREAIVAEPSSGTTTAKIDLHWDAFPPHLPTWCATRVVTELSYSDGRYELIQ
jgi:hypothetical protein